MREHELINVSIDKNRLIPSAEKILSALHYTPGSNASVDRVVNEVIDMLRNDVSACGAYSVFSIDSFDGNTICSGEITLQVGEIIGRAFARAESIAVFTASIGNGVETKADEYMKRGDMLQGFAADKAGSIMAEKAAAIVHATIRESLKEDGIITGNRYSPGYCGWDVSNQKNLFSLLPEGICGIQLTASSMMMPVKSVSGIIPVGRSVAFRPYECTRCDRADCVQKNESV